MHNRIPVRMGLMLFFVLLILAGAVANTKAETWLFNFDVHFLGWIYPYPSTIDAADIDGDGDLDVIAIGGSGSGDAGGHLTWWQNEEMVFTRHDIDTSCEGCYSVLPVDLDQDGDMDIVVGQTTAPPFPINNDTYWLENDGDENFTWSQITSGRSWDIFAEDVNDDGEIDLLIAGDGLKLCLNDGEENFDCSTLEEGLKREVFAVHVDSDDHMDIISASSFTQEIKWWQNDGSENFVSHPVTPTLTGISSIDVVNLDGDADVDIVVSFSNSSGIAWYENDSSGSFSEHILTTTFSGAGAVSVMDFDDDLDQDILVAGEVMSVWLNDGFENFTMNEILPTEYLTILAVDLDEDSDGDVIAGDDHNVRVFEQVPLLSETIYLPVVIRTD